MAVCAKNLHQSWPRSSQLRPDTRPSYLHAPNWRHSGVNFVIKRPILAHEEELTLADLLSDQVDRRGLRLLILSAGHTAIVDQRGARDEGRRLAAGRLQSGAAPSRAS